MGADCQGTLVTMTINAAAQKDRHRRQAKKKKAAETGKRGGPRAIGGRGGGKERVVDILQRGEQTDELSLRKGGRKVRKRGEKVVSLSPEKHLGGGKAEFWELTNSRTA